MDKLLPSTIDIRITQECNKDCEFCFGTQVKSKRVQENWDRLILKLKSAGVTKIVITGGEPTLIPELGNLVSFAHEKGFTICLSTNGTLAYREDIDLVLKSIDWISLPVEGDSFYSHSLIRHDTIDEYNEIFNLMKYAKEKYHVGVKIGTVITQLNLHSIENIPFLIHRFADNWKLYQVYLEGKSDSIWNKYFVSDSEYYSIFEKCKQICKRYHGLGCTSYDVSTMNGKYLFCEPNADAMTIYHDTQYIIGNFLDDFEVVCDEWNKYVNKDRLNNNFNETYRRRLKDE